MTQISLDMDAATLGLGQLGSSQDAMGAAAGALRTPHLGFFPPHVLAHVVIEQAATSTQLEAGRAVVALHRARLAQRMLLFSAAGGGSLSPAALEAIYAAFGGSAVKALLDEGPALLGILEIGAEVLGDIDQAGNAGQLLFFLLTKGGTDVRRWESAWKSAGKAFDKKFVGKGAGRVLFGVGVVLDILGGYRDSSGSSPFWRGFSGTYNAVVQGVFYAALAPVAIVDSFIPDKYSGFSVSKNLKGLADATIGLIALPFDSQYAERFSQEALAGDKGYGVQLIASGGEALSTLIWAAATGDGSVIDSYSEAALRGDYGGGAKFIGQVGDRLGGALYDGGVAFQEAGDAIGGAIYDAAAGVGDAVDGFQDGVADLWDDRPSWLGGD